MGDEIQGLFAFKARSKRRGLQGPKDEIMRLCNARIVAKSSSDLPNKYVSDTEKKGLDPLNLDNLDGSE